MKRKKLLKRIVHGYSFSERMWDAIRGRLYGLYNDTIFEPGYDPIKNPHTNRGHKTHDSIRDFVWIPVWNLSNDLTGNLNDLFETQVRKVRKQYRKTQQDLDEAT